MGQLRTTTEYRTVLLCSTEYIIVDDTGGLSDDTDQRLGTENALYRRRPFVSSLLRSSGHEG